MGVSPKQVSGDGVDWWSQELFREGKVEIGKVQGWQQRQATAEAAAVAPLRCPRCDSQKTKFCYYNNYSRSQPRHFCKSCRRHWTNGGTLRNVPVGGGRKNKRPKTSRTSSTTNAATGDGNRPDQEHRLPTPSFVPDRLQLCSTLLRSSTSPSTTTTTTVDARCSDGSNVLLGSSPCLPPMPPPAMTDPFYTSPSYYSSPFKRNRLGADATAEEQDRATSSYLGDVGGGLFPLPAWGFGDGSLLEPSSAGGDWDCWDELAGLPDLGRI